MELKFDNQRLRTPSKRNPGAYISREGEFDYQTPDARGDQTGDVTGYMWVVKQENPTEDRVGSSQQTAQEPSSTSSA
jgi:hypothetical protein